MLDRVAGLRLATGGNLLRSMTLLTVALGGVLSLGMNAVVEAQMAPASPQANSQAQGPQQMTMDQRMARLTQVLNLTPAQQQQIRPVLEQAQAKMQALAADNATPMADRQAAAQKIREDVRSQIDAVLTPEQKQRVQGMQQHGPGGPGTPPQPQR